jgi:hypothetical protein
MLTRNLIRFIIVAVFFLEQARVNAQEFPYVAGGRNNFVNEAVHDSLKSLNKVAVRSLWAKTYGDSASEEIRCIKQTYDGGYIVAGMRLNVSEGGNEVWILKLNSSGEIEWQKLYKNIETQYEKEYHEVYDIIVENDGYAVVGNVSRCDSGYTGYICPIYGWVMKLNSSGEIVWQKGYKGGGYGAVFYSGHKTADGGYIVAGQGNILGVVSPYGNLWVVKLNRNGVVEWQRMFESVYNDTIFISNSYANSVQQTRDGGYVIAGSVFGSLNFFDWGEHWVLKLDNSGNLQWHKIYSSPEVSDVSLCIRQTNDGGYIVAGQTQDTIGYGMDGLLLKLDKDGNIEWQRNYESGEGDGLVVVEQTNDGGYIAGGLYTAGWAYNGGVIIKTDSGGHIEWQKIYPCNPIKTIVQTIDTGYVFGSSASVEHNGWTANDYIVIKTDIYGNTVRELENANVSVYNASLIPKTFNVSMFSPDLYIINTNSFAVNTNVTPRDAWGSTSVEGEYNIPLAFKLEQNYPNPFNSETVISFSIPMKSFVSLKVFDILGREVGTLVEEELSAGKYTKRLDAKDLTSGVYFYRLQAGKFVSLKKMVLIK